MCSKFIEVSINELTAMRLGVHGSIHGVFIPMSSMLQLSRALKHTAASSSQKFIDWDQITLSGHIVMLSIARPRKTANVYLLSTA
jgi:hypothetical protein